MTKLEGVIAAAATPLAADLSIDLARLVSHCRWLLGEGGCDGINLLGTTGEATSFSAGQRIDAMRAVADGGLPLDRFMVGTGAAALDDAVRLTAEARKLGFAGALLLPPFYYKGIDEDGPYSADVVARLRDMMPETVKGLKDSSGDLDYSADLVRRLPGFDVFPSAEASLGRASELGFAGCISATANVTGRFAQLCWSGEGIAKSQGLAAAVEIRAAIARFPLVASVKAALGLLAGDSGWNRVMPPLNSLSSSEVEALRESLRSTGLLASAAA